MITNREKDIIKKLNHPLYTVEFLEIWIKRDDNVMINAPAALQAVAAKGFYEAIQRIAAEQPFRIGDKFQDDYGIYTLKEIQEDADCVCYYLEEQNTPGMMDGYGLEDLKEMELISNTD